MTIKTPLRKSHSVATLYGVKALTDEGPGIFSAVVSVFGNVDLGGDRIKAGAFAGSLVRWKASGDPIPVIFSHQWDNLEAHVGAVMEAKELLPGDPLIADTPIAALGGLWTKFALDVEDPDERSARLLAKRLTDRTIKEFSFAYDVLAETRNADGTTDLLELDIIEVGPTLKGMNPATVLLGKALGDDWETLTEDEVLDRLAKAVADHEAKALVAATAVSFEGAIENEIETLYEAGVRWAQESDIGAGGFYRLHQEATYPADARAIVCVEGWDDPYDMGQWFDLSFTADADGLLSVAEAAPLDVTIAVEKKGRGWKHREQSAPREKTAATVSEQQKTGTAEAKAEEPSGAKAEEQTATVGTDAVATRVALAELDLLQFT